MLFTGQVCVTVKYAKTAIFIMIKSKDSKLFHVTNSCGNAPKKNEPHLDMDLDFARHHKDYSEKLWSEAILLPAKIVRAKSHPAARRLYNMHRQVWADYHRACAFSRLSVDGHGILYGKIETEHDIGRLVISFFMKRFPVLVVALENCGETLVGERGKVKRYKKRLYEVLSDLRSRLPLNELVSDLEKFDERTWEDYYNTQSIAQRRNKKHFLRSVPKKVHHRMSVEKRGFLGSRNLLEYF
jgi:hypothetical protein